MTALPRSRVPCAVTNTYCASFWAPWVFRFYPSESAPGPLSKHEDVDSHVHILWTDWVIVRRSRGLAIHILPQAKCRNPNKDGHLRPCTPFLFQAYAFTGTCWDSGFR